MKSLVRMTCLCVFFFFFCKIKKEGIKQQQTPALTLVFNTIAHLPHANIKCRNAFEMEIYFSLSCKHQQHMLLMTALKHTIPAICYYFCMATFTCQMAFIN